MPPDIQIGTDVYTEKNFKEVFATWTEICRVSE